MVFFDIDGTLYDQRKKVPESTVKAIALLQRQGIATAIATGRAPFMFAALRAQLGIDSYVSFNGSYTVFRGEPIVRTPIARPMLEMLAEEAGEHAQRLVFQDERTMASDGPLEAPAVDGLASLHLNLPLPAVDRHFYQTHDVYQALLFYDAHADIDYLRREPLNRLDYVRWHPQAVDVIPGGGSKAVGIQHLLNKLGLTADQICAFGDGNNDVEMLRLAGIGVAMGNGVAPAKQAADYITRSADEDGIYHGLRAIGLI